MEKRVIGRIGTVELSKMVAEDMGITQGDSKAIIQSFIEHIEEALINGISVQLNRLGTLKVKEVSAKPEKTMICYVGSEVGKEITVPAKPECNTVRFKVGKELKEKITEATANNPYRK